LLLISSGRLSNKVFKAVVKSSVDNCLPSILSTLVPSYVTIVVAKLGSLFKAVANSFKVSNVSGAELTNSDIF